MLGDFLTWIFQQPGMTVTMGQVLRTAEMQAVYLKTGASKKKNSQHLTQLAADLNLFLFGNYQGDSPGEKEAYRPLGEMWEKMGPDYGVTSRWGGRFGVELENYETAVGWDANHFEVL